MNYKETYIETFQKYIHRTGAASLLNWLLETDFFLQQPDTTECTKNYAAGPALHSLNVFDRLRDNCACEFGTDCGGYHPFPEEYMEPIAIVSLLHDVYKAKVLQLDGKNAQDRPEHGTQFDNRVSCMWGAVPAYPVDDMFPYGSGEKSVYLISEHMRLTREEALAIRFHMGDFTDSNTEKAYKVNPLALQLHIAHLQATYLDETPVKQRWSI